MSAYQMSLTQAAALADSAPDEGDDLQALGARLLPRETTVIEQTDGAADRVATAATCPRCGAPYDGEGICPEHAAEGDLVDDPFRTAGGTE